MRSLLVLAAAALLAGCRSTAPPAEPGPPTPEGAAVLREEVMAADRAFAAASAAAGLEGWMSYIAPDAVRLVMGGAVTRGLDSIRAHDAGLFARPDARLRWEPTDGGVFADGRYAFTTGTARFVERAADGAETVTWRGVYVTTWRREPDGRWLVVLDTGADG